ncbi:Kringle domain [Branchiostoma belcheri]|nr:Kringle domain [Branchiostoma belcheri]
MSAGDRLCQRWDSQSPHIHPHTPQAHPDAGLEENNFCRNPDHKDRPWCYTTDGDWRWDYCDVMECADPTSREGQVRCGTTYTSCSGWVGTRCGSWRSDRSSCQCDQDCSLYGDCCQDMGDVCPGLAPASSDRHHHKCLPGYYGQSAYWLVADCPDDWPDDITKQQCLKQADPYNPSDLIYRMPVEDNSTRVHYRNIFCASCNNAAEAVVWRARPVCSGLIKPSTHFPGGSHAYNSLFNSSKNCHGSKVIEFDPLKSMKVRRCYPQSVDYPSSADCDACSSYTRLLRSPTDKIYKNVHCALCEGFSLTSAAVHLRCAGRVVDKNVIIASISLTNLFNFNADGSRENGPTKCPSDTLYDPFVDTCRRLASERHVGSPNGTTSKLQNCSRSVWTFTAGEFDVLPNGSVLLLSSGVSCPAEQVTIVNTTASICGDCLLEYFSNDTKGGETISSWEVDQGYLTLGLVAASTVAVVAFVVHTVRSEQWKNLSSKLKVQMMSCLAVAETLFVLRVLVPHGLACTAFAILLHYHLLTAFTSMNALSYDLFLTFREGAARAKLHKYVLYTWLAPVPVVVAAVFVEFFPAISVRVGYGEKCWIGDPIASLVAFGVPVFCALLANAVLTILVLLSIRKSFQIADAALSRSGSSKAWVYLRISFLMGFTWILGFVYPYIDNRAPEYIFIVLNASYGLLLTLLMTLTSEVVQKIMDGFRERFHLGEPAAQGNGRAATTNTRQTTTRGAEAMADGTGATAVAGNDDVSVQQTTVRVPGARAGGTDTVSTQQTSTGGTGEKAGGTDTVSTQQISASGAGPTAGETGAMAASGGTDVVSAQQTPAGGTEGN